MKMYNKKDRVEVHRLWYFEPGHGFKSQQGRGEGDGGDASAMEC